MDDKFLEIFNWLTPIIQTIDVNNIGITENEKKIFMDFRKGWGTVDSIKLLQDLTDKYGEQAGKTIEKVISVRIKEDWVLIGKKEAHPGTEIKDFIRVLWEPLKNDGFEFTNNEQNFTVTFNVTKCPLFELAKTTGLYKWLYHFGCAVDYSTTSSFSSKIEFSRTKTLMEGDSHCDHCYRLRNS